MTPSDPTAIDPHRPWIRDVRDDPGAMNWPQILFNPTGSSPKLHFTRAWTFMFMGRLLLFIVPVFSVFVASLAGADLGGLWEPVEFLILPIPELLVPFFLFTVVTELTSWVAHTRRFNESNRSPLMAMIVLIPLFLALVGFSVGAMGGMKQFEQMQADAAAAKVAAEQPAVPEGAEAAAASAEGEKKAEDAAKDDGKKQQAQKGQQRRGRPGPPPTERQMAVGGGFGMGMIAWLPASFIVMLWTLLYVARIPNGGVGKFKTGSDVAQGEEEVPPAYAIS
ncbi:MAG: hypothetical protein KDA53_14965 [Hyphomonas sp.]|nr:hypothetical protein [Hyphomonas sp.]